MDTIRRYIKRCIGLLCLLALFGSIQGQTVKKPVVEVTKRKALVGPYCLVNQFSAVANVATNYNELENITDEDLDNCAAITGIKVGVAVLPILSVKDTKNSYKAGTTAGFTLVSTKDGNLLSLDVIKMFSIATYLNGEQQELIAVKEASSGGLGLNLIQLPGSDNVCVDVSITTTKDFDEIYLMSGGVNVQTISKLSIKYAFVGNPKEVLLTHNGLAEYGKELNKDIKIDMKKCGGMPWSNSKLNELLLDEDTTNFLTTVPVVAIAEAFRVQIGTNYEFPAGTEVGFKFFDKGLLSLNVGGNFTIKLYDENNNEVQREVISADILGLGVIKAGEVTASIISKKPFYSARLTSGTVLGVNATATGVYYGFVKEKPEVYHHCPILPSMSATICESVTTYELRSNPKLKIDWKLVKFEPFTKKRASSVVIGESVNGVAKVTGLSANGVYTFKATVRDCTSEPKCSETIILTKGVQAKTTSCGTPIINEKDSSKYELSTSSYGVTGSLISISNIKNKSNVLDGKYDNYASYVSGLSLASNMGLIGIKTIGGEPIDIGIIGDKRVGFIVENASTFLDADVLQFMRIRLFRSGKVVYEHVIDETNTIGAGLIGTEHSQKIRYSIKVPSNVEFDEFQLWTSGVLNLGLNTLRIYYGFIESADDNCSDPLANSCASIVSTEDTDASLSLKIPFQTASVGGSLLHADRLLDGDMSTALTYTPGVGAGTGVILCVKLGRTVDKSKQLGLALDDKTYLLGAGLGTWMTIYTYLDGEEQEKFTDWKPWGLDVIGYGARRYLFSQPTKPYDEVRIAFAGVLSALEGYNLYGLFFRSDIDGDGLPDCMDSDCCSGSLVNLQTTPHICEKDTVVLLGETKFENETERDYKISIFDQNVDINKADSVFSGKFTIKKGKFNLKVWENTKVGRYQLVVYDKKKKEDNAEEDNKDEGNKKEEEDKKDEGNKEEDKYEEFVLTILEFTVHPRQTIWLDTVTNTSWNKWENWSDGSPWTCTNVIIPDSAKAYPILVDSLLNGCNYIHFEPNAEVKNTHYLDYQEAWVDIKLHPNRYYMVAAPLKRIYSGDWFIAAKGKQYPKYFTTLDEESYPENRVMPTIYQRIWDATSLDQLINANNRPFVRPGDKVNITMTGWTKPFNWLATTYDKNTLSGFEYDFNALSVWIHPYKPSQDTEGDNNEEYLFRFPKAHSEYHYYDENGTLLSVGVQIKDRKNSGRFIYEPDDEKVKFPLVMRYKNESYQNKTFLVGNPFMTHVNVVKLLEANKHLSSVKIYNGKKGTFNSLIHKLDGDGILTVTSDTTIYIAPMQSFFVTCSADIVESCAVTFTEDMLMTGPEIKKELSIQQTKKQTASVANRSIHLVASADSKQAAALVHFSSKANDHYRENEDAEILMENEVKPAIAMFTVADQRALDIQQRQNGGDIPLGIYLEKPANVTLSVTVPDDYDGWILKDWENNRIYPLLAGRENPIELGRLTTNIGRFSLSGKSVATGNGHIVATQPKVFCCREEGSNHIVVRSSEQLMVRCEVFTINGRMAGQIRSESNEYQLPVGQGIYVVKVYFQDKTSAVVKVF